MAFSKRLQAGAAVLICERMIAGATAPRDKSPGVRHEPLFRHIDGKEAVSKPQPFLRASDRGAAPHPSFNRQRHARRGPEQLPAQHADRKLGGGKPVAVFEDIKTTPMVFLEDGTITIPGMRGRATTA